MGTVAVARTRVETKARLNTMNNRIKSLSIINKKNILHNIEPWAQEKVRARVKEALEHIDRYDLYLTST